MTKKIGYANPPEHTRWKKGQSGNPGGRTKRAPDFTDDVIAELSEVIQITEGGKVRRITKQRALIKALTAGGIKGNPRAASLLIGLCASLIKANPDLASPDAGISEGDRKIVEDYLEREVQARLAKLKGGA